MKNIKIHYLKKNNIKLIQKTFWIFVIMLTSYFFISYNTNNFNLLCDITNNFKSHIINQSELYKKIVSVPNSKKIIRPVIKVIHFSDKTLQKYWYTYWETKVKNYAQIPDWLKTYFPIYISNYINKYKYLTFDNFRKHFSNPEDIDYFTFMRRLIRTIWTATYNKKYMWIKNTWTHAGIDIISSIWTPVYSISTWLVVETKYSRIWFWNYIGILYQINWKYYEVFYAHLSKILVKVWNIVWKWEKIWLIWSSWKSTAPHLHFQVNKIFVLEDIVSRTVMKWRYKKTIKWVIAYTVNPISFVEQNLDTNFYKNWDNFLFFKKKIQWLETNEKIIEENNDINLIKSIQNELSSKIKKIKKHSYIKNIKFSLINNEIQLWHWFSVKISVYTWIWQIAIKSSNSNLQYNTDLITNPTKQNYTINFLAIHEWKTDITFLDWKSIRKYTITIYKKWEKKIFWLNTKINKFNLLSNTFVEVYPIDRFWNKINKPIKWNFKIYFESWDKKTKQINILADWKLSFFIKWEILWKSKLVIQSNRFLIKKNIITNISKDYSYKWIYSNDIAYLIKNWIIKWDNWNLLPYKKLSRRELLIIIWRAILNINYNQAKNEMINRLKIHWKFFKDINWKKFADPYIFIAWKKWIIKWQNWNSLTNSYVSKWELLTIFTRLFNIPAINDPLNMWIDLDWWKLKAVADTAKKYNLYPFNQFRSFNSWKIVSRLISFETLYRYLNIGKALTNKHLVAPFIITDNNTKEQLEQAIQDIFNF